MQLITEKLCCVARISVYLGIDIKQLNLQVTFFMQRTNHTIIANLFQPAYLLFLLTSLLRTELFIVQTLVVPRVMRHFVLNRRQVSQLWPTQNFWHVAP